LQVDRGTAQPQLSGRTRAGEYSAEIIQVAALAMAANMRIEQLADIQLAFPNFTEARDLGT